MKAYRLGNLLVIENLATGEVNDFLLTGELTLDEVYWLIDFIRECLTIGR